MVVLTIASLVSVLCAGSVAAYTVPQLMTRGVVHVRSGFETMVVFPTLFGLLFSLVAAISGTILLARGDRRPATVTVAAGQLLVWVLTAVLMLSATLAPATGWELLGITYALVAGHVFVAAGLTAKAVLRSRRALTRRRSQAHAASRPGCAACAGHRFGGAEDRQHDHGRARPAGAVDGTSPGNPAHNCQNHGRAVPPR